MHVKDLELRAVMLCSLGNAHRHSESTGRDTGQCQFVPQARPRWCFRSFAVALALVTGWLEGELLDRLGVGVDRGAHLDAPSSLSGRPAAESAPSREIHRAA